MPNQPLMENHRMFKPTRYRETAPWWRGSKNACGFVFSPIIIVVEGMDGVSGKIGFIDKQSSLWNDWFSLIFWEKPLAKLHPYDIPWWLEFNLLTIHLNYNNILNCINIVLTFRWHFCQSFLWVVFCMRHLVEEFSIHVESLILYL